jgi:hypothetical protein
MEALLKAGLVNEEQAANPTKVCFIRASDLKLYVELLLLTRQIPVGEKSCCTSHDLLENDKYTFAVQFRKMFFIFNNIIL